MPRSRSATPSRRYRQSPAARRVRWVQRSAIVSIALGSLLAVTTGMVHAQAGAGAQAAGGAEEQTVACRITVPPQALTATGLATPWVLSGADGGACAETAADQAAFIDATIFDPATGKVTIYRPLVVTEGATAAAKPVPPPVPHGAVVEISVGFNGDELTVTDANNGRDIADARCVNGLGDSIFGQEIFCNARAFYAAANGKVAFNPPLGTSPDDGGPCPTTESWEIVDQDQSDNTTTNYLVQGDRTAQNTAANRQALGGDLIGNGSDNNLYTNFYAPAVHCQPPQAPDLTDPAAPVQSTSSALLNLFARASQSAPAALVPLGDPFTQVDGEPSLRKTNLYRAQVDQPTARREADASTATYCRNLLDLGLSKIELDKGSLQGFGRSPDPTATDDLHLFILERFKESWDNLGCEDATGIANPVTVTTDADGHILSAKVTQQPTSTTAPTTAAGPSTTAAGPSTTAAGPSTTAAGPSTAGEPAATAAAATTAAGEPAATAAAATTAAEAPAAGAAAPTAAAAEAPALVAVAGQAEGAQGASMIGQSMATNARPAGTLPFTGLDSRVLLLAAGVLMCAGGWLLLWAGRIKRGQRAW